MDLQKGGRWAKLMDEDVNKISESTSVMISEDKEVEKSEGPEIVNHQDYKIDELKSALKNFKNDQQDEKSEDIKQKYRSMEEIKSAFEELNLNKESDFEAMTRLLASFRDNDSSQEQKLLVLQDLEYYVHQVDNANDFAKINGLETVLQALNSSDPHIKEEAAHVVGSAVQSNPKVQVKVVELGGLPILIRLLSDQKQPMNVRNKAMYALSSLIRNFPAAQYFFSNSGGFSSLRNLFKEKKNEKLQMKAISLINDLVVERKDLSLHEEEQNKEKIRQYNLFSLSSVIDEIGLCLEIVSMLKTEAHDNRETLLTAVKNLHNICTKKRQFVSEVSSALRLFQKEYEELRKLEEKDGDYDSYFHEMYRTVNDVTNLLKQDSPSNERSEL